MSKSPKLSNVQNERMGGLIAVLCHREPYPWLCDKLKSDAFIELKNEKYFLTDKGYKELERLMTLCGLAMFYRDGALDILPTKIKR
jgi:hypothetical protein